MSGCATATRGTHEMLNISSEPIGAMAISDVPTTNEKLSLNGFYGCEPTPCGINLPRKSSPVITISKPGYDPIKFKVTSAVATSSSSIPTGTLVAGLPPGSHVIAGSPDLLKRIPVGGQVLTGAIFSMGIGAALDLSTGANKNLTPNPVTAVLVESDKGKTK